MCSDILKRQKYFHGNKERSENTFVISIYQNTYEFQQNSVINMTYIAMTTHIPWLPHYLEISSVHNITCV